MMTTMQLKDALRTANLSKLARHSGLSVRTLRRIKNGHADAVLTSTIEKVALHLKAAKRA